MNPAEADLVREVFRQYLAGSGAKSTARGLNQRGLLYRKHLWTRDLVLRVISDPGVVGTYYWGKRGRRVQKGGMNESRASGETIKWRPQCCRSVASRRYGWTTASSAKRV